MKLPQFFHAYALKIMRITLTQLLCAMLFIGMTHAKEGIAQTILEKPVSVSVEDEELNYVLSKIEKMAKVTFSYIPQHIQAERRVTLTVNRQPLSLVLKQLFKNTSISYELVGAKQILLVKPAESGLVPQMPLPGTEKVSIPDQVVTGTVRSENGEGLPGVSIVIKNTTQGTTTDADGKFRISMPESSTSLVFSFVGYQTQEITPGNRTTLTVTLKVDTKALEEVVVIGYGERQKKDVTGAVSVVGSEDLIKAKSLNPELAMQGRLAGVYIATPGGAPNQRPTVRIRGQNTLGNNEPLYVVDGVPITETSASDDTRGNINVLAMINPNDIESISVLKDASSAAIYGVRAANGVILITTKKGKAGKPRVEVSASRGVQNIPKLYSVLDVNQWVTSVRESFANNPAQASTMPNVFKEGDNAYLGNLPNTDWQSALLNKNAVTEDYGMKVSGGGEGTSYYFSAGYARTESPLVQNNLERYSIVTNLSSRIGKIIEVGLNNRTSVVKAIDNTLSDISSAWQYNPWQPIYTGQGAPAPVFAPTFTPNAGYNPTLLSPGVPFNAANTNPLYGPGTRSNVFGMHQTRQVDYSIFRTLGSAYLQIEPLNGLKLKATFSGDWYPSTRNDWTGFNTHLYQFPFTNPYAGTNGTSKGGFRERISRNLNTVKEFTANYNRDFNGHKVDVLLSAMDQFYGYTFTQSNNTQSEIDNPDVRTLRNNPPFSTALIIRQNFALQGYLARLSYNYKSKYYIDATVRRDGTSRFAPEDRWGTFPSTALAWRVSAEPFMQNIKWITDLKIRAGIGELGNQETGLFAFLSQVNFAPDYALGSGNGDAFGGLTNGNRLPDIPVNLTWERILTKNLGLDAAFFNGKLTATVEYYDKQTSGILQSVSLPPSAGLDDGFAPRNNVATVRNNGFEMQIGYNGELTKDITYTFSGNLTTVNNKVTGLYQDRPFGTNNRTEIGQPIGYFYGYQVEGIFQNQSEIDARRALVTDAINADKVVPGDMYFKDTNGDGKVDANDRTYIGKTIPGFYYGFNLGGGYKGLDVSIFFQGVGDIERVNDNRQTGEAMTSANINWLSTTLNRWTPTNPSTTMPRAVIGDPASNNRFSDRWIESAAFMRLKNLQIGYTIPRTLVEKSGFFSQCRLSLTGNNLLTFTKYSGLDPENDNIPPTRSWIVGLNLSF